MKTKILIATGIFPPDIGGPALYSQRLAEEFSNGGIKTNVITYGKSFSKSPKYSVVGVSRIWPSGLRQLIYFLKLLRQSRDAEAILVMDSLGAGLPGILAGKILNKKVVVRLGGDFLWEKFVEASGRMVTVSEFYDRGMNKKYSPLNSLIGFVLRNADFIVFTTALQRDLFIKYYQVRPEGAVVISNAFEKRQAPTAFHQENSKTILWAGRFIKLKNLELLIKVFKRLLPHDPNLTLKLIGDGPEKKSVARLIIKEGLSGNIKISSGLDKGSLLDEIEISYFCILPSLFEVSPNFALECLGLNKPIILTQETGIKDQFPGLTYADPKNENSFFMKALRLLDKNSYDNYRNFISNIKYSKTWEDLAAEYLSVLQN